MVKTWTKLKNSSHSFFLNSIILYVRKLLTMINNNLEQDDLLIPVEPIELFNTKPYQDNYYLRGQTILIGDSVKNEIRFPLTVYYVEIVALIHKHYIQSLGPQYKEIPFGVLLDKTKITQLRFKRKNFLKFIGMVIQKLKYQGKKVQKLANKIFYYSFIDIKEYKEVLESQYVEDSIRLQKDVILLKLDAGFVETLFSEDKYKGVNEGKNSLLTRYFSKPTSIRKKIDIHLCLQYLCKIVNLHSINKKVMTMNEYFGELHKIADFVNQWRKFKGQSNGDDNIDVLVIPPTDNLLVRHFYLSSLRNYMAEHKNVRKKRERDKAYTERKKRGYDPLKSFLCSFLDCLIRDLKNYYQITFCDYCGNIFLFRKNKKYCSKVDGKIGEECMNCGKIVRDKNCYQKKKQKKKQKGTSKDKQSS